MRVTGVRIYQDKARPPGRGVLAFGSVCLDDCFVVHELRVIAARAGDPFVAMPSRRVAQACPACGCKNHLLAKFCNECGSDVCAPDPLPVDARGQTKIHYDVAHPTNSECRADISRSLLSAHRDSMEAPKNDLVTNAAG